MLAMAQNTVGYMLFKCVGTALLWLINLYMNSNSANG